VGSGPVLNRPQANFLRGWKIDLYPQGADQITISSDQSADPLRVVFSVETYALMEYWQAQVDIYNASTGNQSTLQANSGASGNTLVQNASQLPAGVQIGTPIAIAAGYKSPTSGTFDPNPNLIYQGNVFQPMLTRENVVDTRLRLRCMFSLIQSTFNMSRTAVAKNTSDYDALQQILKSGTPPIPLGDVDDKALAALQLNVYSRGRVFFDRQAVVLQDIVRDNNLISWLAPNGLNIRSMDMDQNKPPDFIFGPPLAANTENSTAASQTPITRTLLGVPEQTQDGILFRVLMDSRIKISTVVQLAPGTVVNQFPIQLPNLPPLPNQSQTYFAAGVRHVGDSRGTGEDWYTEVHGVTLNFFPTLLQALIAK